jgi:hypothetical protein
MAAKYFNFVDGQRLPGARVKEFLMNQAVIQCENQTEITSSGIEALGARVAINLEDGQLWTYTPDIEAWAPAQNTLDLDLLDARYYTKVAANGIFISETTADARYLTEVTARGIFLTQTDAGTTYYTKLQADGLFMTETTSDARYYTKLQADGLFITTTVGDARYITEARAGTLFISKGGAAGDINGNSTTIDGGKITTNSINVNRLVAGTLTGFRVQTSSSGQRVVMSESTNSLVFFNSGGTEIGRITGLSNFNYDTPSNHAFQVNGSTVFSVNSSGVALSPGTSFNSNLDVNGSLSSTSIATINGGVFNGGTTIGGSVSASGAIVANADSSNAKVTLSSSGALTMDIRSGVGTVNALFDTNGNLLRQGSSARYKQDIEDLVVDKNDILNMQPKSYRRIEEVEELGDNAVTYGGFIAENLAGTSLDKFVSYMKDEDGNLIPDGVYYGELTAALVTIIKDQEERLNSVEARLAALEGGAQ